MKLSVYKNPRNEHTYKIEKKGKMFMLVERDWMGDEFQIMAFYDRIEKAQSVLDTLSDNMGWKYCGEQKEVGFVD
jgi:hypothetical protein